MLLYNIIRKVKYVEVLCQIKQLCSVKLKGIIISKVYLLANLRIQDQKIFKELSSVAIPLISKCVVNCWLEDYKLIDMKKTYQA